MTGLIEITHRPGPIWACKIGVTGDRPLPMGCDAPMRQAVKAAFRDLVGEDAEFTFSGWSATLTEGEMALDPKEVERELRQDWRERALKAEAEAARLRVALSKISAEGPGIGPPHTKSYAHGFDLPAAPTPADGGGE